MDPLDQASSKKLTEEQSKALRRAFNFFDHKDRGVLDSVDLKEARPRDTMPA